MNETALKTPVWIPTVRRLIGILVPLVYFPLMLRMLGQEDYGLHSMADSIVEFLMLLTVCMGGAFARLLTGRHEENDPDGERRVFGLYVKTYAAAGLLILAVGLFISFRLGAFSRSLGEEELEMLKKICLLMTVDAAVFLPFAAWEAMIGAHGRSGFLQLVGLIVAVVTPCANLAVLALGWASIGLVSVSIAIDLIVSIAYVLYVRKKLGAYPAFRSAGEGHMRHVLHASLSPFLDLCAEVLFVPADRLIVGWALGSLMAAVYNVGASISVYLIGLCALAGGRLAPHPAEEEHGAVPEGSRDAFFIRCGRRQFILLFFVFSLFAVFGRQFLRLWAGSAYARSYGVVLLTFAALAIALMQEAGTEILHAAGRHLFHVVTFLCTAAASVLLTLWWVKPWGVLGAAAATCVTYVIGAVVMNVYYHRVIGLDIPLFWKRIARMLPVPLAFGVVCWFAVNALRSVNWAGLIGLAVLYAVLYFLLARRFMMNAQERALSAAPFRKAYGRVFGRKA